MSTESGKKIAEALGLSGGDQITNFLRIGNKIKMTGVSTTGFSGKDRLLVGDRGRNTGGPLFKGLEYAESLALQ